MMLMQYAQNMEKSSQNCKDKHENIWSSLALSESNATSLGKKAAHATPALVNFAGK